MSSESKTLNSIWICSGILGCFGIAGTFILAAFELIGPATSLWMGGVIWLVACVTVPMLTSLQASRRAEAVDEAL